ncbi:alpha/beta hydrolase family protein [Novipirellula caenicola]|uniref:Peptidase S9 prolyl oligopeptidase catalytic domain-containing protein n=1 Tax=Novipirellula caenicola TaxID=1536901 RepID=A0ABP9W1G1_9BACT
MSRHYYAILLVVAAIVFAPAVNAGEVNEVRYLSSADDSQQPAMFYNPNASDAVPLVVALHTWSGDYKQDNHKDIQQWCIDHGWAYIHPNFRGPNVRPQATGSELVVKDIVSAVDYAKQAANIDPNAIYLVGTSGGGYTSLVMAGRHPEIWAGVSAWVPISDLTAWYQQCKQTNRNYYKNIAASCGGVPGSSPEVDEEYRKRSPLTYLANAKDVKLHLHAGIRDGHDGSVPISHSLLAFNEVAAAEDRLSADEIAYFDKEIEVPESLNQSLSDPSYGSKQPLFRRTSGNATVTIFDGRHELIPTAAIAWIESVHESRRGTAK